MKPEFEELLPQPGDGQVGYRVFSMLEEILKAKESAGLATKWTRNYELWVNHHWKSKSKKVTLTSANLMYSHLRKTVNLLTDNSPTFNVLRSGEGSDQVQDELYDKLRRTAEYWWSEEEQQAMLERSVLNGEVYGATIEKVFFNPDREFGLGEVETEVVDPFYFGMYPPDTMDIQKAEAVFHFYPMSLREARRRWPDKAEDIKGDTELLLSINDTRKEIAVGRQGVATWGTFAGVVKNLSNTLGIAGGSEQEDRCLVLECWVKDYSENNGVSIYPGYIRCVTTCAGGTVVLSDRPNPSISPLLSPEQVTKTYLYDKFPFSFTQSVTDTTNPWGMSDFEQLRPLQEEIDKTLAAISTLKDKAARLKLINPSDSGVDNSQFTNFPGIINPTTAQTAMGIKYMEPPAIPQDLVKALEIYKDYFQLIAGSFELERAQAPGRDVIAYQAIAALIEHAGTMLRGKIRNYSRMIRERGRMYISCVCNWYTEDRYISYDMDGDQMSACVRGEELIIPAKLTVVSGSTMPKSIVQQREEATELFKLGAIDKEELLRKLEWPDRKSVLQRMSQGPLSQTIQEMTALGYPDQITGLIQQLSTMDDQQLKQAEKEGQLPSWEQLLPALTGQQQQDPAGDPTQAQIIAEIEKIKAETQLILERVKSEQTNQSMSAEQLRLEKAKFVKDAQMASQKLNLDSQKTSHDAQLEALKPPHMAQIDQHDAALKQAQFQHQTKMDQYQANVDLQAQAHDQVLSATEAARANDNHELDMEAKEQGMKHSEAEHQANLEEIRAEKKEKQDADL